MARKSKLCAVHGKEWLLITPQFEWFKRNPIVPPVYDTEASMGLWSGHTAFVVAPGPSLSRFPLDALCGKLTISLNSAIYVGRWRYACFAETGWCQWFRLRPEFATEMAGRMAQQDLFLIGRTGVEWQLRKMPFRRIYLMRHQEEYGRPVDQEIGSTIFNAIAQARHMGCTRVVLIGADLSRAEGAYVKDLPHDPKAERDPLVAQREALKAVDFSPMEVLHVNPHCREWGMPWTQTAMDDAVRIARDAPEVSQE